MSRRWPAKGDTMTFLGENGYQHERDEALKAFTIGTSYTVVKCDVGGWSHSVYFEEVAGGWNGVMFSIDGADEDAG